MQNCPMNDKFIITRKPQMPIVVQFCLFLFLFIVYIIRIQHSDSDSDSDADADVATDAGIHMVYGISYIAFRFTIHII
jgi:hypothetical protein